MNDQFKMASFASRRALETLEFNLTLNTPSTDAMENCLALAAVVGMSMLMGAVGTLEETLIWRKELVVV